MYSHIVTCNMPSYNHLKRSYDLNMCSHTVIWNIQTNCAGKFIACNVKALLWRQVLNSLQCWYAALCCFITGSLGRRLLLRMKTELSKSKLCKQKRPPSPPLPHCDGLTSVFHPCSSASMAFQRFLLLKSKGGSNCSPNFMDHPVKLARPLAPCSGLTASINKVPINNNIVS
jgi:hypothetical protein